MKTSTTFLVLAAATLGVAGSPASAGFMSQFDSLPAGADANGVDGWQGWNNVAADAGVITSDLAYQGPNSLLIEGYTDAVQRFSGITSGQWSVQAKQYIPSGQKGLQYFIILNSYADGAMSDSGMWSTQLKFDVKKGTIVDDFRGGSLPLAFDQWADIRVDVDLDANRVDTYYNDSLLSTGSWTRNSASHLAIAALDLYSSDKNLAYYDNISVAQIPAPSVPGAVAISAAALIVPIRRRRVGRAS